MTPRPALSPEPMRSMRTGLEQDVVPTSVVTARTPGPRPGSPFPPSHQAIGMRAAPGGTPRTASDLRGIKRADPCGVWTGGAPLCAFCRRTVALIQERRCVACTLPAANEWLAADALCHYCRDRRVVVSRSTRRLVVMGFAANRETE